jgi:hypothetical protein
MNKNILLVMKWLKNPETVTQEELEDNFEAARSAVNAARSAVNAANRAVNAANRADYAAYSASYAAYSASYSAAAGEAAYSAAGEAATRASYWIDEYFKSTGEDKKTYIDTLGE